MSAAGSADTATFDVNSGVGTATVDSNITVQTLTMTGFTGTLAFGTNTLSLNSTGTVYTGAATFSVTGTPVINVTSAGSTAITVATGAPTEANSISFNFTGGTYALSFLNTTSDAARNVNFTGFGGTWVSPAACNIYGSLTLSSAAGFSVGASSNTMTFAATSAGKTIDTKGKVFDVPINFNGVGGVWQLQGPLVVGASTTTAAKALSLTNGSLDLNGYAITTGVFSSSSSNVRTLAFGSTGTITCINGQNLNPWTTSTSTNLTVTGTPVVNISYAGATACSVSPGTLVESQAISFNFTTGAYSLTFPNATNHTAKNVNFTGFTGTWATRATTTNIFYGNFTLSSGMTYTGGAGALSFNATSGVQILTTNAITIDSPMTLNGIGGTLQFADAVTLGSTRAFTLTNGTLNLNNQSLTVNTFNNNTSNVRTLAFGSTGVINVTGITAPWPNATTTNLTVTGTSTVNITNNTATTTTITTGTPTEAQALNFNFTAGTYTLVFLNAATYAAKSVNFTGFAGTWSAATTSRTLYGSLTLSSGMAFGASSGVLTFAATSGTQVITTNAKTLDEPVVIDGVGGTFQLGDNLAMGATRALTLTNGTFDGNSKTITGSNAFSMLTGSVVAKNISTALAFAHTSGTLTQGGNNLFGVYTLTAGTVDLAGYILTSTSFATGVGTKNLTFNGGTLICAQASSVAFNNANPTGFTTTAGTGTGTISMTAASIKTFAGGGSTYNCTLSNDGAGSLIVSGSNTFLGITNGVSPTAFIFTAGTTQTMGSWTVSGTSTSARVTITSTAAGTAANLVKTGGGIVSANYLSLKDSAATPALLTWYAGPLTNSVNVSGNSGWIFLAPPGGAYTITALNGAYTLNGQSAALTRDRSLTSVYGVYALSGQSISITRDRSLTGSYGAYSLTGQVANLVRGRNLIGSYGSYSLTGQNAILVYASGAAYNITASAGSYTLNGQNVGIYRNRSLTSNYGAYAVTGQTADIYRSRALGANFGSYALIGSNATVVFGRVLLGSAGNYAVAGQDATLLKTSLLLLDSGVYSLTGQAVNITYSGEPIVESVQYLIEIRSFTERRRI